MISEVAAIRQQIADEYIAAKLGLQGLASGTSRHAIMIQRTERISRLQDQLRELVGDQAIPLVAETLQHLPDKPTRQHISETLQHELGNTEETTILLDHITEVWDTADHLTQRFGPEVAQRILQAPEHVQEMKSNVRNNKDMSHYD